MKQIQRLYGRRGRPRNAFYRLTAFALLALNGAAALADDARPADEPEPIGTATLSAAAEIVESTPEAVADTVVDDADVETLTEPDAAGERLAIDDGTSEATPNEADSAAGVELASSPDLPVAPNVDLKAPQPAGIDSPAEESTKAAQPAPEGRSIVLLDTEIEPGTSTRLSWRAQEAFDGIAAATPVLVVNGARPGPVLCVTAAVHGDELNGIEMVRRTFYDIQPKRLAGTLIGVPIVNLDGFRRNSRYLSDRRDLNRYFPGNPRGSSASRIAYSFFNQIILQCEALVDLHTGSFHRTNLPQLRANLKDDSVRDFVDGFGNMVVLHSVGAKGTLRRAATNRGIPAVTLEAGEPLRLQKKAVSQGVRGLRHLLSHMGMYGKRGSKVEREPHYYKSHWIRADQGGILFSEVSLGDRVRPGKVLGTITDPITNVQSELVSEHQGRVLGMALNQVLMPGFAAFRIGISTTEEEVKNADAAVSEAAKTIALETETDASSGTAATAIPDRQTETEIAAATEADPAQGSLTADSRTADTASIAPESSATGEVAQNTGKIRGEDASGDDPAATYEPPPSDHPDETAHATQELLADSEGVVEPVTDALPAQETEVAEEE